MGFSFSIRYCLVDIHVPSARQKAGYLWSFRRDCRSLVSRLSQMCVNGVSLGTVILFVFLIEGAVGVDRSCSTPALVDNVVGIAPIIRRYSSWPFHKTVPEID